MTIRTSDKTGGILVIAGLAGIAIMVSLDEAVAAESIRSAITEGKVAIDLRYRYEYVDQNGLAKEANASTLRTRLGYETGSFMDVSGLLEFEDITVIGNELYNNTFNGRTSYPVVADPATTEINRAFLRYNGLQDTVIDGGRQRIVLGNQRFVGNVGWRQNEQTFDALSIQNKSLPDTELTYAYLINVHTITGTTTDSESHLFHGTYTGLPVGRLDGYLYMLDLAGTASDSQTLGVRFSGKQTIDKWTGLRYAVELATQSDYADAPGTVDADYLLLEIGGDMSGVTAMLGYEVLGGDGTYGFQTPLATKHVFNGWADKFLTTPTGGLEDLYVSAGTAIGNLKLLGVYHDFSPDSGGGDYGSEFDFLVSNKIARDYDVGVKLAMYNSNGFATDTDKIWMWISTKF